MINVIDAWHRFIKNVELRRFVVLLLIVFALWMMRSMMNMILLPLFDLHRGELGPLCPVVAAAFSTKLLVILTYLVPDALYFG